jgi:hypothetical protein
MPSPLENLPSASSTAFSATRSSPRRLLPRKPSDKPRDDVVHVQTAPVVTRQILLLAGRDPPVKRRILFDSTKIRMGFLEEARGMKREKKEEVGKVKEEAVMRKGKEKEAKKEKGEEGKKRAAAATGERKGERKRPRKGI